MKTVSVNIEILHKVAMHNMNRNIPISLDINIPKYNKKVSGELYLLLGMSLDSASLRNQ